MVAGKVEIVLAKLDTAKDNLQKKLTAADYCNDGASTLGGAGREGRPFRRGLLRIGRSTIIDAASTIVMGGARGSGDGSGVVTGAASRARCCDQARSARCSRGTTTSGATPAASPS